MAEHAKTLEEALASTRFTVRAGRFVLAGFPSARAAEVFSSLQIGGGLGSAPGVEIINIVVEPDVVTVVAPQAFADVFAAIQGARVEKDYCIITFVTPMTWDVVGFLAFVTRVLADAEVPVGAVCGYDRDHLFIHERHLSRAKAALSARVCPELL